LRDLNRRGEPEAVIRWFESGRISSTEATLCEYVKALVKVDRLDGSLLSQTLSVSATQRGHIVSLYFYVVFPNFMCCATIGFRESFPVQFFLLSPPLVSVADNSVCRATIT
jgi:hypothetical protein